jgi:hypothetical protein
MATCTLVIDVGDANTTAATAVDGQVPQVCVIEPRSTSVPSALWLHDDGSAAVGSIAVGRASADRGRFADRLISDLWSPTPRLLDGAAYSGVQLLTRYLAGVIEQCERSISAPVTSVVVAVPQRWTSAQIEAAQEAAALATVLPVSLVGNAHAAGAEWYAAVRPLAGSTAGSAVAAVVCDAGGIDLAVLDVGDTIRVLATGGTGHTSGADVDAAVFTAVCARVGVDPAAVEESDPAISRLRADCADLVHRLTIDDSARIDVWLPSGVQQVSMTQAELSKLLQPIVSDWVGTCHRLISAVRGRGVTVDRVVLVGDHAAVPGLADAIAQRCVVAIDRAARADTAVAVGAARLATAAQHPMVEPATAAAQSAVMPAASRVVAQAAAPPTIVDTAADDSVTSPGAAASELSEVIASVRAIAAHEGRNDLVDRLDDIGAAGFNATIRLLVVGDFKQGKSTLVNSLLGHAVCPADADFATAVPTAVRHGAPSARLFRLADDGAEISEDIELDDVARWVDERRGADATRATVNRCEVTVPVPWMAGGVELVDMPGFGGADTGAGARILADLHQASAVLFVSDASQELTRPEVEFLSIARQQCATVGMVLTKIDNYLDWRRIRDLDAGHLRAAGFDVPILPVSALRGIGIGELVDFLQAQLVQQIVATQSAPAINEVTTAGSHLLSVMRSEVDSYDPARQAEVVAQARRTINEVAQMRLDSAPWHRLLDDRRDDLMTSTIDGLDGALRDLVAQASEAIGTHDPAEVWNEFQAWLRERTTGLVSDTYVQLTHDAAAIEGELINQLAAVDGVGVLSGHANDLFVRSLKLDMPQSRSSTSASESAISGSWKAAEPLLGIGGFLPGFGPVSLAVAAVAGLAFGRRAMRARRETALDSRRTQARGFVEEYLNDVQRVTAKPIERYISQAYRTLRDGVLRRVDELERSATDTLTKSAAAANDTSADRALRRAQLQQEIAEMERLMEQLGQITRKVALS